MATKEKTKDQSKETGEKNKLTGNAQRLYNALLHIRWAGYAKGSLNTKDVPSRKKMVMENGEKTRKDMGAGTIESANVYYRQWAFRIKSCLVKNPRKAKEGLQAAYDFISKYDTIEKQSKNIGELYKNVQYAVCPGKSSGGSQKSQKDVRALTFEDLGMKKSK